MSKAKSLLADDYLKRYADAQKGLLYISIDKLPESLSKIYSLASQGCPYAFITAFKDGNSRDDNHRANDALVADMRDFGLGGTQLNGYFKTPTMDAANREISFFIPYLGDDEPAFRLWATKMCNRYDQYCVGYSDGEDLGFLYPDGRFDPEFSSLSFDDSKINMFWSQLRSHKFAMIESGVFLGNNSGKYLLEKLGIIPANIYSVKAGQEIAKLL
jgi:hypothetical protein